MLGQVSTSPTAAAVGVFRKDAAVTNAAALHVRAGEESFTLLYLAEPSAIDHSANGIVDLAIPLVRSEKVLAVRTTGGLSGV